MHARARCALRIDNVHARACSPQHVCSGSADSPATTDAELGDIVSDSDDYWEVAQAQQEIEEDLEEAGPIVEQESDFALRLLHPATKRRLLRQSVIRLGEANEAVNFYCYLHQCKKCVRGPMAPGFDFVKQWALKGLEAPAGAQGRAAHLRQWDQMMAQGLS